MTPIAVLGGTTMDLVAHVSRAPERGETVTGHEVRTIPGGAETFVDAPAVALGAGEPVPDALAWAAAAAALSVQRPGASTSMPYRAETDSV
ncbi:hypothetical protein QWM81_22550 [Streptomyces ficellus]|uniref:Uncharacterized protein n=1 Tax=Streptomyces ficellus TaxID=1977088 RepID=A0ABT7ZBG3_9ACTN|nr:hypothetical protein [Streptomyces ficellus]MDN3296776.1 hypothetical protein [Streptomyces ficellus]